MFTPARLGHRAEFYHQFASYAEAGIPILQALEALAQRPPARWLAREIFHLHDGVTRGWTLAESLRRSGSSTPVFDIALIEAGESSGRLDATFKLLSSYYRDRAAMINGVILSTAYPVLLVHVGVLIFPISSLTELVTQGAIIPFVLQKLAMLAPIYLLVAMVIWFCQGTRGEAVRSLLEAVFGLVPILGKARRQLALARLSAALEALINAGVLIVSAWPMAAAASGSPALGRAVRSWDHRLQNGVTPAELVRSERAFPEMFSSLYSSGEISGKLDESLLRLHRHYQEEGTRRLKIFSAVCAGTVYGLVALAVAWQVVSFYIGYLNQINDAMK